MHFLVRLEPQAWALQPCRALQLARPHQQPPWEHPRPTSEADTAREGQLGAAGGLTGKGDVEAPLPCGVVSLELETGHVAAAGDGGGQLVS